LGADAGEGSDRSARSLRVRLALASPHGARVLRVTLRR
jgi:hypothetical protein